MPFMSQGSHAPDTVWIIVEPDMCIYKIDAAARLELVQARMPQEQFKDYESFGASIEDPAAQATFMASLEQWREAQQDSGVDHVPWPAVPDKVGDRDERPPWRRSGAARFKQPDAVPVLSKQKKTSKDDSKMNAVSTELLDLILYFNAACRLGRKGLLWCGWNASQWSETKKCRSNSPAAGAHLVMVSTEGARFLMSKRHEIPNMHMGNFLSKMCGLKWQHELGAAYLVPPVGSYVQHPSTTTVGQTLMSHFDAKWAQEGTRPYKDGHVARFIAGFTEKGHAEYLHKSGIDFRNAEVRNSYLWLTQAPPFLPRHLAGLQDWHRDVAEDHLLTPPGNSK